VEAWLTAARDGDTEAFGQAMEACRQYLTLVADRELDSRFSAKGGVSDIVQETFLDAQRGFERFSGRTEAELRSWLHRIMRNNLVSFVRRYRQAKRQVTREVPLSRAAGPSDELALAARTNSPSGHAIEEEQAQSLARGLERLPERQRCLIVWRHQEHCSFEEIGQRLAITPDAARMAWARAIKRLQQELFADGGPSRGGNAGEV
jgi:RNA polymerase sigma-70 factor (ECF subfamily)